MQNLTKEGLRLLEILKSDEELLKDIEELKFGCILKINKDFISKERNNMSHGGNNIFKYFIGKNDYYYLLYIEDGLLYVQDIISTYICHNGISKGFFKILGQANYEHLLRYLENKPLHCIYPNGVLYRYESGCKIQFNLKKPLLEQEEEVLKELCDYLLTL